MTLPKFEFVSWQGFHRLCFGLAKKIESQERSLDTIVSISRGGHVISRIFSDFLNLPIFNVSIQSYKDLRQEEVRLTQKLGQYLSGQKVLLVDEIVDSGKTLTRALQYLRRVRAASVVSVACFVKSKANPKPKYFAKETDKWVVFPYEVRETIEAVRQLWQQAGWKKIQMKQTLIKGGFDLAQVERYLV